MAQENFNVSLPNDGLGDALRDAFIKQQSMNTELYTTKVDKVVGKDLSTNDFTNALKSKLDNIENFADVNVQADWLQTDDTADDYIKNKPNFAGLVPDGFTLAETTLIDQEFTINAAQWYVNSQLNILPFSFPALSFEIPLAGAGLQRLDLFYGTNVGTIERIEGDEATVAVEPTLPPNSVRLTVILTTDTESEPPAPIDFSGYILKNSFAYLPLSSLGGAPEAPASLNFITTDGDGVTGFSGFQSGSVFVGQRMIIRNDKTTDFELTPAGLFDFTFDQNYTIKAGDNIEFDLTADGFRQVGIDAISRKGTAEGFPIVGDLVIVGAGLKTGSTSGAESYIYEEDGFFYWSCKNNEEATPRHVYFSDTQGLEADFDFSETELNELLNFAQRSYVLGVPKSTSFTAQTNGRYRTTHTLTVTDTATENYFVQVQSGVCTIGGVAYVAGDWVWRVGANSYKINGGSSYITSNTTALNNRRYIANGTFTVSDISSPVAGSNYEVVVRGGSVTVGGVAYQQGNIIQRIHNGSSWATIVLNQFNVLTVTSSVDITTSVEWNNKIITIDNGANDINITTNHNLTLAGNKNGGSGIVTFINGSVTNVLANGIATMTGIYDTFSIIPKIGSSDNLLYITRQ